MTLALLPAVDVAGGQSVRLARGDAGSTTTHGPPRDAALGWQADGAEWVHLVDLDAAFGRGSNADLLAALVGELDVSVQLSGGIDSDDALDRALATGCARVNLATTATDDQRWCARAIAAHGERIAIALDVRVDHGHDGTARYRLAARGTSWRGGDLFDAIERLDRAGCARYVVTDVSGDGMLQGPNLELYRAVAGATTTPLVASGGIASIDDLVGLANAPMSPRGCVEGAIVGKALYAGRFTLRDALAAVRDTGNPPLDTTNVERDGTLHT